MLKPFSAFFVLLVSLSVSCSSLTQQSMELFNGKNLDNWDAYLVDPNIKKEDVWRVRDGLLICKGEPLGFLYTKEHYTSYRLEAEWRWAPGKPPGNNGILMRVNGLPKGVPRCIEMQLKSGSAGDLYGFHGMKIDGDKDRRIERKNHPTLGDMIGLKKIVAAENPPGEWNRCEIIANGPHIKVWINGKLANEAIGCDVLSGPVAIQSEGGEIHFRKITLFPIRD